MKRISLLFFLSLLAANVCAQDTLIMQDGNSLVVKILDITNDKVKYKAWSNLNGPTWIKSMSNIKSIRRLNGKNELFQDNKESLNFSSCSVKEEAKNKKNSKKIISGNTIVRAIDSIYIANAKLPTLVWRNYLKYLGGLPEYITIECIENYYLEQFDKAVSNEEVNMIIQYGETYIYLGAEKELPRVAETLAKVSASEGDEAKSKMMIDKLKEYSAQNDNMLDEDISQLQTEVYTILHPRRFEDEIIGKWVLPENISYNGSMNATLYSPIILEVLNVTQNNGAHIIPPTQKIPKQRRKTSPSSIYNEQINTSQDIYFDGQNMYVAIQFATLVVKDRRGYTNMVHSVLEGNQDTRAKMKASIASSKASSKDKLAATMATELTIASLDALFYNMNTSSKKDEVYNMVLFPKNENVMNAIVSHIDVTTTTPESGDPTSVYNEYVKDKKMQFVRWEEEDSLVFISANSRPITLREISMDDPLLDEYRQIKRRHSLRNPAYFLPLMGGNVFGALLIKKGINLKNESFERDVDGNKIPNGGGGYLYDEKKNRKAACTWCIGGLICIVTSIAVPSIMIDNRDKAYMDINRRNLEKLRCKAKASVSFSPTYDPMLNSLGANINLTF